MFTEKTTSNSQKVTRTKCLRVNKFPCSDGINPLVDTPLPSECNVERFNDQTDQTFLVSIMTG